MDFPPDLIITDHNILDSGNVSEDCEIHDELFCDCPPERPNRCQCHKENMSTCTGLGYTCYSDDGKQIWSFLNRVARGFRMLYINQQHALKFLRSTLGKVG